MQRRAALLVTGLLTVSAVAVPWLAIPRGEAPVGLYGDPADMAVPGDSDVYDAVWHFWWARTAVLDGQDPMFCPLIYHPTGASLSLHNIGWPSVLALSVLSPDPVASLNTGLFVGTLLVFVAAALLARQWGAGAEGAFVAGFIVSLMPSRVSHLYQHYMVAQIGWSLLALFFFTESLDRKKRAVPLVLFSALAALESLYHSLFLVFGAAAVLMLRRRRYSGRDAFRSAALVAIGIALAAAWYIPRRGPLAADPMDWREAVHWSAEPVSYLLPSSFGLAGTLSGLPLRYGWMPNTFEGQVSCGLTVFLLFCAICAGGRRPMLAAVSAGIILFSLGPLLKLGGTPLPVPLPWMVPARIPVLAHARVPARLGMLFGTVAAVTVGAGWGRVKPMLRWPLLALMLFELFIPRFPVVSVTVPSACSGVRGPVLDLPAESMVRITSFYQTRHAQPRLTSFLARGGSNAMELAGLKGLMMGDSTIASDSLLRSTAAETALYHRMLLPPEQRRYYDSLYAPVFTGASRADSVWVWRR